MSGTPSPLAEHYNTFYAREPFPFGGGPTPIVRKIPELVEPGPALDIGAGAGRHSLFLARAGFQVTAVDFSRVGIEKLREEARAEGLQIDGIVGRAQDISWEKKYVALVMSLVLHQLPTLEAQALIEKTKENTQPGGVHAVAALTRDSDFFREDPEAGEFYLELGELKRLYADWEIIEYEEGEVDMHARKPDGQPKRGVVARIVTRKPAA